MPRGFEFDAILEPTGQPGHYRLRANAPNLRGEYLLADGRLAMAAPENQYLAGLVWEVKNRNVLLLTEQPDTLHVGSDYRNATLSRSKRVGDLTPSD
jgi:hypothetical protein